MTNFNPENMKKILCVFGACAIILACNNSENPGSTQDDSALVKQTGLDSLGMSSTTSTQTKGEQLIASSDCLTCHKVESKIVGPSYIEVANKYEESDQNIEMLAGKIIDGGSGSWGEIPMAPHPALSVDDAKEMVKYLLSLKTN